MLDNALMAGKTEPKRPRLGCHHAGSDGFDRPDHAALSCQQIVGDGDDADIRCGGRRGAPQRDGDGPFVARGAQCAYRYERRGRRAADACVAMYDQRLVARPTLYKGDELFHMLALRRYVAVLGSTDVVQLQPQMIFRRDRGWTRQIGVVRQQRNDVEGSGCRDGLIEPRQRTYVNHYTFLSRE